MDLKARCGASDGYQQTRPVLALPLGVVKKFGDDEGAAWSR